MSKLNNKYFVMSKGKESYLVSWFDNQPNVFGRKVYYIGVTNGLGGYRYLLEQGFQDRRFNKPIVYQNKSMVIWKDKALKRLKQLKSEYTRLIKNYNNIVK